ncbi:MAG: ABC transporter ATP-binding protein [Lachnospiraceae bacterium]|nr:ABC transporter ATP-binding protein [Lachnospiraceae bacterium]
MVDTAEVLLDIRDLDISFASPGETIHAIRGVNLTLRRGETVALVGESGSGKSVTMKAVMGILPANATVNSGSITCSIELEEKKREIDLLKADDAFIRRFVRGKKIAMVFQDPMTSLNPTMTIGNQLIAAIRSHERCSRKQAFSKALNLLREVGITEPERRMSQYPHEFSGGMRQRIVIAIALSCDPEILICDEPTTALDVTIQERILELIVSLQRKRSLSVIYITHDLGVVAKVADYVNVMYAGRIIETGTVIDVFYDPRHPYTWGLLSAIPDVESDEELYSIPGTPPVLSKEPEGDAFAPRNPYALEIDLKAEAPLFKISNTHSAATWLLDKRAPKVERPESLQKRIDKMKREAAEYVR